MNRSRLNYWVDIVIGIAFLVSAISGLVFLVPPYPSSGSSPGLLGISYGVWNELHTWSSLAMMGGVLGHLLLHWEWIIAMTRRMVSGVRLPASTKPAPQLPSAEVLSNRMGRRAFLRLGGLGVIVAGLAVLGSQALVSADAVGADQPDASGAPSSGKAEKGSESETSGGQPSELETRIEQPSEPRSRVACPFGVINDAYSGRCRRYRDSNGNGYCDLSQGA